MNITVLGGGAWGSALATHLAKKGHKVLVWEFVKEIVDQVNTTHTIPSLDSLELHQNIDFTNDIEFSCKDTDMVVLAVPSANIQTTWNNVLDTLGDIPIVIATKGFLKSGKLIDSMFTEEELDRVFFLYGPTLAGEVVREVLSGVVLSGPDNTHRKEIQKIFESKSFKVSISEDIWGAQIASGLKNVVTIILGIAKGLELGENAYAYLFVQGLKEIENIGLKLGCKSNSFYSLTGLGDLLLNSRNKRAGEELGRGRTSKEIIEEAGHVLEGFDNVYGAYILVKEYKLESPIILGLYKIVYEDADPREIIEAL